MELLVDLFGYLSIIVHGLTILSQSIALGGVLFLVFLARPLALPGLAASAARIAGIAALCLLASEAATLFLQTAVLTETVGLPVSNVLRADFAVAGLVKAAAAATLAGLLLVRGTAAGSAGLLALTAIALAAATLTTHAAARLDNRGGLLLVEGLHQLRRRDLDRRAALLHPGPSPGARPRRAAAHRRPLLAAVDGGRRLHHRQRLCHERAVHRRRARLLRHRLRRHGGCEDRHVPDAAGPWAGLNFLMVERMRANPATSVNRMRRFAEAELGIGTAIFFAAASLTSVPPAVDLSQDRVTWAEIKERNTPEWPRISSPDRDSLALPALQAKLDQEAAAKRAAPQAAFTPGSGELPPRNADDIAWSEYNHHWSGLFVTAIGLLALLNHAGARWARHWPLLFLGLAVFLFFRSDPETWPMGDIGFLESFRDVEVLQHRFFVLLLMGFTWFEWRVRATGWTNRHAALVFPLLCAAGGTALLTHSHAIANVKDQLLIELTHTPLALAGIAAGWARWLELRLDRQQNPVAWQVAGWVWPACLLFCGLLLLGYREA